MGFRRGGRATCFYFVYNPKNPLRLQVYHFLKPTTGDLPDKIELKKNCIKTVHLL
jgi:hypothetical protein